MGLEAAVKRRIRWAVIGVAAGYYLNGEHGAERRRALSNAVSRGLRTAGSAVSSVTPRRQRRAVELVDHVVSVDSVSTGSEEQP